MRVLLASFVAVSSVGLIAASGHANEINGFFQDVQLIVAGLRGLIEPIGALLLAGSLVLQAVIMRNQKKSADDRKEQKNVLNAQNDVMASVQQDVATIKDLALTNPQKEEGK